MAKLTHKASGRKMTAEEAADFLGTTEGILAIAIVPRKGGGARSKEQILSLCIANACRTVSTFVANMSAADIAAKAAIILKKCGYYVEVDRNGHSTGGEGKAAKAYFHARLQSSRSPFGWYDQMSHDPNPKIAAKFRQKFIKLENEEYIAVESAVDTANPAKLAAFLRKWKYKRPLSDYKYTFAKKINTSAVETGKLSKRPARFAKQTVIVPKREIEKYCADAVKRWGAFGAMFFQMGREFNPKLRLGERTVKLGGYRTSIADRIGNAPIAKKFPKKFYERTRGTASGNTAQVDVESQYMTNRQSMRDYVERACKSAERVWGKNAEKALMAILSFEI